MFPLSQETLPLVERGFAFVQLAQLVGLFRLDPFFGLLVGVRSAGARPPATGEENGAGKSEGGGEAFHTH